MWRSGDAACTPGLAPVPARAAALPEDAHHRLSESLTPDSGHAADLEGGYLCERTPLCLQKMHCLAAFGGIYISVQMLLT